MKKNGLILISSATLLACVSHPPLPPYEPPLQPYDPGPAYAEAPAEAKSAPDSAAVMPAATQDWPGQSDGEWRVALISVRTVEKAAQLSRRLSDQGYRVETEVVEIDGISWQRLVLPGYRSEAEAHAMLPVVQREFGMDRAWVPPRRRAEP